MKTDKDLAAWIASVEKFLEGEETDFDEKSASQKTPPFVISPDTEAEQEPEEDVIACARCLAVLGENDAYCTRCGSPRNEKVFAPDTYPNELSCIYGPPWVFNEVDHICDKCGYVWKCNTAQNYYCPKCGGTSHVDRS